MILLVLVLLPLSEFNKKTEIVSNEGERVLQGTYVMAYLQVRPCYELNGWSALYGTGCGRKVKGVAAWTHEFILYWP